MSFTALTGIPTDIPHYLRDEEDAYALPIILNLERGSDISHEEALEAAAAGVRDFMLDENNLPGGEWNDLTKSWMAGRIRKVARRARASAWDKVTELSGVLASAGEAAVYVLPPHPVDEVPAEIKSLQVAGLDLPRRAHTSQTGEILVALNPDVQISTGKAMAQVGHAVQLAIMGASEEQLSRWVLDRPYISFIDFNSRDKWDFEIQDAGFTEVAPGTLTAVSSLS